MKKPAANTKHSREYQMKISHICMYITSHYENCAECRLPDKKVKIACGNLRSIEAENIIFRYCSDGFISESNSSRNIKNIIKTVLEMTYITHYYVINEEYN